MLECINKSIKTYDVPLRRRQSVSRASGPYGQYVVSRQSQKEGTAFFSSFNVLVLCEFVSRVIALFACVENWR